MDLSLNNDFFEYLGILINVTLSNVTKHNVTFKYFHNRSTIEVMMRKNPPMESDVAKRVMEYELCLIKLYGALVEGKDLRHILGYRTGDAFRQAVFCNRLPLPTFIPKGRRVRVARTHDIAKWLVSLDADLEELLERK